MQLRGYHLGAAAALETRENADAAAAGVADRHDATETQSISSNLLHKKDHSRIHYQRISEATGKEVPAEEIVRGYEVERTISW
jgi:hypothetical protein